MKVFAYCCQSFERATRRAAGVQPITCPPINADSFNPAWLADNDLIYLDLHGQPGDIRWYGDHHVPALTAEKIRHANNLNGSIVFALNCFLADEDSPMMDALLDAGARFVIGGDGPNYAGGEWQLIGAALLGRSFRRLLSIGINPMRALALAKNRLRLVLLRYILMHRQVGLIAAAEDTLNFRAYWRI